MDGVRSSVREVLLGSLREHPTRGTYAAYCAFRSGNHAALEDLQAPHEGFFILRTGRFGVWSPSWLEKGASILLYLREKQYKR